MVKHLRKDHNVDNHQDAHNDNPNEFDNPVPRAFSSENRPADYPINCEVCGKSMRIDSMSRHLATHGEHHKDLISTLCDEYEGIFLVNRNKKGLMHPIHVNKRLKECEISECTTLKSYMFNQCDNRFWDGVLSFVSCQ